MLDQPRLQQLLKPFGLTLDPHQASQTLAYLQLLLHWNQRINLTSLRDPEECVTRHFGESLFIARHMRISGHLLDIGSGAGFPGLALKIVFPDAAVTLLEPVAKKRAFLKEAARLCGFADVTVLPDRLEDFSRLPTTPSHDTATMRAVGKLEHLIPLAANCLRPGGSLLLWLTETQTSALANAPSPFAWSRPLPIPLTRSGIVCRGLRER